jgi:hypothetical protein
VSHKDVRIFASSGIWPARRVANEWEELGWTRDIPVIATDLLPDGVGAIAFDPAAWGPQSISIQHEFKTRAEMHRIMALVTGDWVTHTAKAIIEEQIPDVLAWLREAGHDV